MGRRQPLPRIWMMTDERQGDAIHAAVRRLPRGAGIVFRHHGLAAGARRRLFRKIIRIAQQRQLLVLLAGGAVQARRWGAHGSHGGARDVGLRSAPVHDRRELRAAERAGADLLFLSPVYPTRSHPGAPTLGSAAFSRLARLARRPVIALGGLDARRGRALMRKGAYGWAAIDAWTPAPGAQGQNRKAVPM